MTRPPCKEFQESIVALADGELPEAETQRLEEHLAGCAPCAAELEAHRATWQALELLEGIAARPGWLEAVEREVRAPARGRLVRFPRWVAAAAAALLVGAGLALYAGGAPGAVAPRGAGPEIAAPRDADPDASAPDGLAFEDLEGLSAEELAGLLPPEDAELVRDLEVLVLLAELEDADLAEDIDVLWGLDEEELDES